MDKSTRGSLPVGQQVRRYPAQFEVRSQAGGKVELRGYASTTETPYEMWDCYGPYTEIVRTGAFVKTLAEGADVTFLANHAGLTMARTKNGTLRLAEDSTGLESVATMNLTRSDVRDLVTAVEDGDLDEMSFAFRVMRQTWSPDWEQRDLIELSLNRGDVSAVNFGANPTTSIEAAQRALAMRAQQLHRLATGVRAGKVLSAGNATLLAQALSALAAADEAFDPLRQVVDGTDEALDEAQAAISAVLGVANPDPDDGDEMQANAATLALLRRRLDVDTPPRLVVGL